MPHRLTVTWLGLAAWLLLAALPTAGCAKSRWTVQSKGRLSYSDITESSGVVVSRQYQDVLWTHNDSANRAQLFAIDEDGALIREYEIKGIENNDWEDISQDQEGNLYVLDNTSRANPEHLSWIYVFSEPNPFTEQPLKLLRKLPVRFPDGGFDCETIMVWQDRLYLVTKPWDGRYPRIYRVDDILNGGTAAYVGQVPVYAMITGGDMNREGTRIALSSYRALLLFSGAGDPESLLQSEPAISPLNAGQVEAVAWDGEDLVLTNEQRQVFHIPREKWANRTAPFLKSASKRVPYTARPPEISQPLEEWRQGEWLRLGENGLREKVVRIVWSRRGLHIGVSLPRDFRLRGLNEERKIGFDDWFVPGSFYVMINPDGTRPIDYGRNDRCIVVGYSSQGTASAQVRYLRPATLVASQEAHPAWLEIEEQGGQLLITLTSETPGFRKLRKERLFGFNLLLIPRQGRMISWTPLTVEYPWDSPSMWGLLELGG